MIEKFMNNIMRTRIQENLLIEKRLCIELIKLVGLHGYWIKYMYLLYNNRMIDTNQD